MQRERSMKALPRQQKLALINEQQDIQDDGDFDRENDVQD
jgi:predicted GIY-YIG superfamily endonuclease